jgi:hypothetical protein
MMVPFNVAETMAIDIFRLMHIEFVRLLKINHTTQDEDEQADAGNDAAKIKLMMREYESQLVAALGQKKVDLLKANFETFAPTPTR